MSLGKIMIVEDDKEISSLLSEFLTEHGYDTICRYDGLQVLKILEKEKPDMILLDLMLPYKSGDILLSQLREQTELPVIIISAKGTTQNKVELLRMGADDYITKPFDLEETLARIESGLRRAKPVGRQEKVLRFKELSLNLDKATVRLMDKELSLTAKEYKILELLLSYPDKIFSKANLFQSVWDSEYLTEDNTLNVHISNLRNKIKSVCPEAEYIDTVWGIGYRLHQV